MTSYYAIKNDEQTLDLITSMFQRQSLLDGLPGHLLKILSSSSVLT